MNFADIRTKLNRFYKVLSATISEGEVLASAIVIAYYILFSIFPIIIIIGNVLPLFHIDTKPIANYLSLIFPQQISTYIMPIVNSLLKSQSTGYISFGIVFAVWSFSNLVNAIRIGMNRVYDVHRTELKLSLLTFLWTRSFTILLTALMIIVFTGISLILIFGQQVLDFLEPIFRLSVGEIKKIFSYRYPVVIMMMILAVAYLNYALPNIKVKKRVIWPGVFTTVIGWLALSYGFSFYLHNFAISWENYGIIGTFIIFMLWLNLASLLLLFGSSINATIAKIRYGQIEFSAGNLASYIQKKRHQK
ncbi:MULTISPECIES: YihY/virulence factor BrkB family protein [Lactobacillus]|uniref:YihY/virulence factor BrkB family protein n=1 Tax=Lactobacillus xujianguonis TaxID=2495899 RepID=A0A437SWW3_9LACO|nr:MULTISPECIES: YihY/virulence factor BrkB family protein [Lactobacillus]RVU71317.1 YihY/virulence factor BrkB family protein [Lactobacillus xujianguonis]RVU74020.1 YihY/virulence factor BrkB family protein [Lactobacillus xujianguonis]